MEMRPCERCRRHVRVDETACPFCSATVTVVRLPDVVVGRVSRSEWLAIVATLGAGALIGCDKNKDAPGNTAEVYGAPPKPPPSASASASGAKKP